MTRSSKSAGRGGEILGRFGDCAAAGHGGTTSSLQALARRDSDMLAWWGSQVECASALARLERNALLDGKGAALAFDRLRQLADGWHEIEPSEIVRENAVQVSSRSSTAGGRRPAARGGFPCRRTPSFVARSRHARRAPRRRCAEGGFQVDRCFDGMSAVRQSRSSSAANSNIASGRGREAGANAGPVVASDGLRPRERQTG